MHEIGSCAFRPVPVFVQTGRQAWSHMFNHELNANDAADHQPFSFG